jgi:hypothetical protein
MDCLRGMSLTIYARTKTTFTSAKTSLIGIQLRGEHGIDNDSIVVDLTNLIEMAKVIKADLVILWDKEIAELATDAHVDVCQSSVHVDKDDVVVEDEQIDDEETQMDDESQEKAYEARAAINFPIVEI